MARLALLIAFLLASVASADVVHLKDGSRLEGDVKKGESGYVVNQAGGKYKVVPMDQVKSIEMTNGTSAAPDVVREKLASLRRSVDYDPDIHSIINRYQRFIAQSQDAEVAELAKQDLAVWQQRRDAGLVKFGTRWVSETERAELAEKSLQTANAARILLNAGALAEAETRINQALADDPKNPTALYLKGLLQYRKDEIIPARKSFDEVNKLVSHHGPTLNNLAVIHSRQNQVVAALNAYDRALVASPKNRAILDNVAEMLYAVPDDQRGTPPVQKLARRFTEQDMDLQRELQKQDLHRWGATWVDSKQLEQLKVAERALKDKLDQMSADFDATKVRINNIDRDIEENQRAMRRLEASSYVRDFNGNIYQSVLPSTYYQPADDNRKLQGERDEQYAKLERLRKEAKAANMDLPVPKYTGLLRMIEAEGAPTMAPPGAPGPNAPAATQPVG